MEDMRLIKEELLKLRQAVEMLTEWVSDNNCWVGYLNKELSSREFEGNREYFREKMRNIMTEPYFNESGR